jgi:hypothetical protein
MVVQPSIRLFLAAAVMAAAIYTAWIFANRGSARPRWHARQQTAQAATNPEFERIYGGTALRILQFYAREGVVTEGGQTVICYGVLNARAVRIEPPVEGVFVAMNRCVAVTPEHDTKYTLTAEGQDGQTVSETFLLSVAPDTAQLPKITSFQIANRKLDYRGRPVYLLTFNAQNPETVDIEPRAFPTLHGAPYGRFYVAPEKTTTYTLTVTGKRGHQASRQLTVEVP